MTAHTSFAERFVHRRAARLGGYRRRKCVPMGEINKKASKKYVEKKRFPASQWCMSTVIHCIVYSRSNSRRSIHGPAVLRCDFCEVRPKRGCRCGPSPAWNSDDCFIVLLYCIQWDWVERPLSAAQIVYVICLKNEGRLPGDIYETLLTAAIHTNANRAHTSTWPPVKIKNNWNP